MYLYFSSDGTLKEIVNDGSIRQGNSNINKIKFFIEGADPQVVNNVYKALTFSSGFRTFIDPVGNSTTTESFSLTTVKDSIPFNKKRQLKYFQYWTDYEFFSITIPDDVLNESGTVACRIQMVVNEGTDIDANLDSDDTILTLGLVAFNVQITSNKAIIEPDTAINIAQWNYLIKKIGSLEGEIPALLTPTLVGTTESHYLEYGDVYTGFNFLIGDSLNYQNGIYILTYGNCMITIPVYNAVENTEYKVSAVLINGEGGYATRVLTYMVTSSGELFIFEKNNYIPMGWTGYLFKIKLY